MGAIVSMTKGECSDLEKEILRLNPSLSKEDVDQIIGEIALGRTFRFSSCQRCGGRKKVVSYPESLNACDDVVPVWEDCSCSKVRTVSTLGSDSGIFSSVHDEVKNALSQLESIRLESQQVRQIGIAAESAVKELDKKTVVLSSFLRKACILLKRAYQFLDKKSPAEELLMNDIDKFINSNDL
jgi:hypothetical protein